MKLRRQKRKLDDINITPLIDVVFLLLIFFMVSTTFTKETRLAVELPDAQGEESKEKTPEGIEVLIDSSGAYAVNGQLLVNRKIETLMAALQQVAGTNLELPVVISADGKAPHSSVIMVMDAAGRLGFTRLSFAAQEPQESDGNE